MPVSAMMPKAYHAKSILLAPARTPSIAYPSSTGVNATALAPMNAYMVPMIRSQRYGRPYGSSVRSPDCDSIVPYARAIRGKRSMRAVRRILNTT